MFFVVRLPMDHHRRLGEQISICSHSWRPAPLPCCLSRRRHFDRPLSSVDRRSLAQDASPALPPVDRSKPRRGPFPLRHQAEVEITTLHDLASPSIESSPHTPSCDRTVATGDERNQLCSRWRRSTKGEPSYDLGRMAASDTRRPIGGHRRESSFTAATGASHPFSCP
jgi:hypothetical protein